MSEMPFAAEYKAFRGTVALQKVSIGKVSQKLWSFYDFGPKQAVPLICLPGIAGSADVFFKLILELTAKGYRVVSAQHAPYMSFTSILKGLDLFIDRLKVSKCHLLGEGFGGYLAQCYAQYRPAKVASLVLCNSYCDLQHFVDSSPFTGFLSWMPDVLMKRFLVADLRYKGPNAAQVTSYKFVSQYSKKFNTDDLCSRLTLQYSFGPLKPKEFPVPDEVITIIDTEDPIAFPDRVRLEVHKFYPNAKEVVLSVGGNFPFLSNPVEFANAVHAHLVSNSKSILDTAVPESAASISAATNGASSSSTSNGPVHPPNHTHANDHNESSANNRASSPPVQATTAPEHVEEEISPPSSVSSSSSSSADEPSTNGNSSHVQ